MKRRITITQLCRELRQQMTPAERHLVIELDGQYHEYQQQKDYSRDLILEKKGIKTLRIKNEELMNMEVVLQKIRSALNLTD